MEDSNTLSNPKPPVTCNADIIVLNLRNTHGVNVIPIGGDVLDAVPQKFCGHGNDAMKNDNCKPWCKWGPFRFETGADLRQCEKCGTEEIWLWDGHGPITESNTSKQKQQTTN